MKIKTALLNHGVSTEDIIQVIEEKTPIEIVDSENVAAQFSSLSKFGALLFILFSFLLWSPGAYAQVSGKVFKDFNGNSLQISAKGEPGVAGVTVTAFKPDGTFVTTLTGPDGSYSFTASQIPNATRVRIEFSNYPVGLFDTNHSNTAGSSQTTTQFVTAGTTVTNVNLGLIDPKIYTEVNPLIGVPCYVSGNPLGNGTSSTMDAFVDFDFNSAGNGGPIAVPSTPNDPVNHKVPAGKIGSVWGVAYDKKTKKLYTSAFVKRHTGIGPLGEGGIYILDYTTGAPVVSNFVDVNTIGINTGTVGVGATPALRNSNRGLNNTATLANTGGDPLAFDAVGKVGLGDIDISEDGSKLWVVNLNLMTLNSIVIDADNNPATPPTTADVATFNIPNPFTAGTQRPFALKTYNGKVYIGLVSDATLEAAVYEFNGSTFTSVLVNGVAIIPLNYNKGFASIDCNTIKGWFNWRNSNPPITCGAVSSGGNVLYAYPTPMLSDIEFDVDSSMILTFMDRMGHQMGTNNTQLDGTGLENYHGAGDILRVCRNNGSYVMQGSNGCAVKSANNEGPGGGEYYFGDYFNETESYFPAGLAGSRGVIHSETVVGGMAVVYGSDETVVASFDPRGIAWISGGVNFFNNTTGQTRTRNYMLYYGQTAAAGFAGNGFFGKANGLGDVEVLNSLPTIELGNRVWNDANKNGIQDPTEAVLVGVTVSLYDSLGVLIPNSTLVTDANGQFIFSSAPGTSTANFKYGLNINPNTQYQIKIDALGTNASVTGLTLADVTPLTPGETAAINSGSTISNNDAKLLGGKPTVVLRTGILGENNHTFDLGLACTQPIITAGSYTKATCPTANNVVPNNNASLQISTNGDRAAISATGIPTTAYASATAVTAGSVTLINQNGATDSLFVRIFKGPNCYLDTVFKVTPVICCPAITFGTPANFTQYCSDATIATLTATTTARLPDSLAFYMSPAKLTAYSDILGAQLLGKVRIAGTATSNNVSLSNVKLPEWAGTANDTLYIYAVYVDNLGDTTCKVFAEKPIILKPEPTASIDGFTTACNSVAVTLTSEAATTYRWGRVLPFANNLGTAQTLTQTPPANTTTTYWLITTNAGTCSSDTAYHTITTSSGILGTVYRDFDSDGIKDINEKYGVKGIEVKAYDCDGKLLGTTKTDEFGRYAFNSIAAATGKVRIEFSKASMPSWLQESFAGTNNGTDVQFVTAPNCSVDWAVKEVGDYCQTTPKVLVPCFENGTGIGSTQPGFVSFDYGTSNKRNDGTVGEVGSVWGVAYQRTTRKAFTSAFLKRHVGFADQGPGGIYVYDYANPAVNAPLVAGFSLQGVTPANGGVAIDLGSVTRVTGPATDPNYISTSRTAPNYDIDAFAKVGKMSYGDADVDETNNRLWLVNLNQRAIISMNISGTTTALNGASTATLSPLTNQYLLDNLPGVPNCGTDGVFRPWALAFHRGKGYLGGVCSSETSKDRSKLVSYVLEFDPNNVGAGFTTVMTIPMDYPREQLEGRNPADIYRVNASWRAWINAYADIPGAPASPGRLGWPQPILSDIAFADNGDMVMGFTDRLSHQWGMGNYLPVAGRTALTEMGAGGDILHACFVNGTWVLEGTAGSCKTNDIPNNSGYRLANDGPSKTGEFYPNDQYNDGTNSHFETSNGALAILPGQNEVITTAFDISSIFQQGVKYFNTTTGGNETGSFAIVPNSNGVASFGKGNGLGDLEITCDAAPIQIGNYIWLDADADGVQDPCELPAVGVKVYLYSKNGLLKDSTVTNATGNWYFSSPTDSIKTNTAYFVVVGGASQFNKTTGEITVGGKKYQLTSANTGVGTNADQNDSDALTKGIANVPANLQGFPVICDTTGGPGYVNHTLDIGLAPPSGSLGDYVWKDTNNNGRQEVGEAGVKGVIIELYKNGTFFAKDTTDALGKYNFVNLDSASYYIKVLPSSFPAGCLISQNPNAAGVPDSLDSDIIAATLQSQTVIIDPTPIVGISLKDNPTLDVALFSPNGSLGDYVWKDTNNNGIQDEVGTGVKGVILELYKNGIATGIRDTTDVDGKYLFAISDSASYQVKIVSGLPAGCALSTKPNAAGSTDANDSDFNPTTGLSDAVTVNPANPAKKDVLTVDAALYSPKGSLGDFVWKDTNNNGIQDETTPNAGGVAGVQIELYKVGTTSAVAKDTTDATGHYLFSNLDAGQYYIKVLAASIPVGCTISTMKDVSTGGGTEANDSDVDPATGQSGNYTIDLLDPLKKDIVTVDAALLALCPKPTVTINSAPTCSQDKQTYSVTFSVTGKNGILKANGVPLIGNSPYVIPLPIGTNLTITDSLSALCRHDTTILAPSCGCPVSAPVAVVPSVVACQGEPIPMLSVSVPSGVTANWYASQTSTSALVTNSLTYTPAKAGRYWVEAVVNGPQGCVSTTRTPITLSVRSTSCVPMTLKKVKR
ncbi:SdrD B-like domain-containing protein [Runella slithyformis]|uniref:Cna B domain protein n=1 Tax=Runella slithyformis (strain ATCC 29530 / DSM 19594 / LMG 11500 / NCIMB 11436 / LSU 4) TaxID=761193 RepID=A0A7U4E7E2_RUNSL|nr:SdrD B-like domain-containing protein [Runella slithyformis]AEI50218.1 Cna B domain protein [Runella slithyformis DSM 19594]